MFSQLKIHIEYNDDTEDDVYEVKAWLNGKVLMQYY